DIWVLTLGEKVERRPWLRTPFNERAARFSPDGHWLAYVSNESGRDEVYVQPFPGPGGKWQISISGGTEPVWSHAGSEIFYRSGGKATVTFVAGTRLGPYEILAPIGAGGMGEVYRARDTKLHRDIVIKTLRGEVASDADRVRRFEQEAQSASALNHPNIITIY